METFFCKRCMDTYVFSQPGSAYLKDVGWIPLIALPRGVFMSSQCKTWCWHRRKKYFFLLIESQVVTSKTRKKELTGGTLQVPLIQTPLLLSWQRDIREGKWFTQGRPAWESQDRVSEFLTPIPVLFPRHHPASQMNHRFQILQSILPRATCIYTHTHTHTV